MEAAFDQGLVSFHKVHSKGLLRVMGNDRVEIRSHLSSPEDELKKLISWISSTDSVQERLAKLIESVPEDTLNTIFSKRQDIFSQLLEFVANNSSPRLSEVAIKKFMNTSSDAGKAILLFAITNDRQKSSLKYIKAALKSNGNTQRLAGTLGLRWHKGPDVNTYLLDALSDTEPQIRTAATQALQGRSDPFSLFYIEKALNDEVTAVRAGAIKALEGRSGDKVDKILEKLVNDSDYTIRVQAVGVLSKRKDKTSSRILKQSLDGNDHYFKRNILYEISKRRDPWALDLFSHTLKGGDNRIGQLAAVILAERNDLGAIKLLENTLMGGDVEKSRIVIEEVLKAQKNPKVNKMLEDVFSFLKPTTQGIL